MRRSGGRCRCPATMGRFSTAQQWVIVLGCLSTRLVGAEGTLTTVEPEEACADFAAGKRSESAWTMADCTEVWTQFNSTIEPGLQRRLRFADVWRETSAELRKAGTPCLSGTIGPNDGVGSTVIRMLSSWVFADEMGCDWVTPYWGRRHVKGGNGTVVYCHSTVDGTEILSPTASNQIQTRHCSVVDWIDYFQLGVPSTALPEVVNFKKIQARSPCVLSFESPAPVVAIGCVSGLDACISGRSRGFRKFPSLPPNGCNAVACL